MNDKATLMQAEEDAALDAYDRCVRSASPSLRSSTPSLYKASLTEDMEVVITAVTVGDPTPQAAVAHLLSVLDIKRWVANVWLSNTERAIEALQGWRP